MRRVVVTGANRGLGLEFVRQLAARGDDVVAGVRQPRTADALNKLAAELAGQGVVVVAMSPGWVATDMGGRSAPLEPAESVHGILTVVDALTPAQSGAFLDHTGATLPW